MRARRRGTSPSAPGSPRGAPAPLPEQGGSRSPRRSPQLGGPPGRPVPRPSRDSSRYAAARIEALIDRLWEVHRGPLFDRRASSSGSPHAPTRSLARRLERVQQRVRPADCGQGTLHAFPDWSPIPDSSRRVDHRPGDDARARLAGLLRSRRSRRCLARDRRAHLLALFEALAPAGSPAGSGPDLMASIPRPHPATTIARGSRRRVPPAAAAAGAGTWPARSIVRSLRSRDHRSIPPPAYRRLHARPGVPPRRRGRLSRSPAYADVVAGGRAHDVLVSGKRRDIVPRLAADAAHDRPAPPRRAAPHASRRCSRRDRAAALMPSCARLAAAAIERMRRPPGRGRGRRAAVPLPITVIARLPGRARARPRASSGAGRTASSRASTPARSLRRRARAASAPRNALALHRYMLRRASSACGASRATT